MREVWKKCVGECMSMSLHAVRRVKTQKGQTEGERRENEHK